MRSVLKRYIFSPGLPIHMKSSSNLDCPEITVAPSCKFVHGMRITSGFIGSQQSLHALFVVSKYVSPTAHFSIQWCILIGKWLSQVSKIN